MGAQFRLKPEDRAELQPVHLPWAYRCEQVWGAGACLPEKQLVCNELLLLLLCNFITASPPGCYL